MYLYFYVLGERNDRIRKDLKVAIKKKDRTLLNKSVSEFKKAKLADTEGDLHKAERILTQMKAKESKFKNNNNNYFVYNRFYNNRIYTLKFCALVIGPMTFI